MGKQKAQRNNPRKAIEHALFIEAVRNGYRPARAATFSNARAEMSRKGCRDRRFWN